MLRRLETLRSKSDEERFADLCTLLQCDDPARFRRKFSGMVLPIKNPTDFPTEPRKGLPAKRTQEIVSRLYKLGSPARKSGNKRTAASDASLHRGYNVGADIKHHHRVANPRQKLTLETLQSMDYRELGAFNPADFLQDDGDCGLELLRGKVPISSPGPLEPIMEQYRRACEGYGRRYAMKRIEKGPATRMRKLNQSVDGGKVGYARGLNASYEAVGKAEAAKKSRMHAV